MSDGDGKHVGGINERTALRCGEHILRRELGKAWCITGVTYIYETGHSEEVSSMITRYR